MVVEVKQSGDEQVKTRNMKSNKKKVSEPGMVPIQHADLYDLHESTDQEPVVETDGGKEEKPMSRAERRRRIKEELIIGSEEAGFKGYRRRMW
jgi:hypothetical protein